MRRIRFIRAVSAIAMILCMACISKAAAAAAYDGASCVDTESKMTVSLTLDKTSYNAGEAIEYEITVTNGRLNWTSNEIEIEYSNSDGILPARAGSMPVSVPRLSYGESYTLSGTLAANRELYEKALASQPAAEPEDEASDVLPAYVYAIIGGGAVLVAAFVLLLIKLGSRKKGGPGSRNGGGSGNRNGGSTGPENGGGAENSKNGAAEKITALVLVFLLAAGTVPAQAASADTVTIRPYVKVMYGGEEITVRAVLKINMNQEKIVIDDSRKDEAKTVTCHDPSIFKDKDGTYYILGTHITGASSKNLRDWTGFDASFRATFSEETIAKIREWNKDNGTWYGYLWAPDVVYNETLGKYCYYLSANGDDWKSNIVMLTSDSVTGPYEYAGSVVYGGFTAGDWKQTDLGLALGCDELPERYVEKGIANRKWGDKWPNCIDPCVFYDGNGELWMSYGSWSGGIFLLKLDKSTGLRDYSVSYESNEHSDAYFGKKIAGGWYVSGEGSYIQQVGDYYYLFVSYGNLEAAGGYNIRIFRADAPDGDYVDALGNSALYDKYIFNYNQSVGVRLFGAYRWRTFRVAQVAQGHNSAFVDDDGRCYIVYHTRTNDGSEGHHVEVHQLFVNENGWLVAAPYHTNGEALAKDGVTAEQLAGDYEIILHTLDVDYANRAYNMPVFASLGADGTVSGDMEGTWSIKPGTSYITLTVDGVDYDGVALAMKVENTSVETYVFTALGDTNQLTVWGSKSLPAD